MVHVLLIGDYSDSVPAHRAIPDALRFSAQAARTEVKWTWRDTGLLEKDSPSDFETYDAFWCVPASPYRSFAGALKAIEFARKNGRSFLGTCGGFQHALIEYARNELGLAEADHTESNPGTTVPIIHRLACSLSESRGRIRLAPQSLAAKAYGAVECEESYNCNFGPNLRYRDELESKDLRFTGFDLDGAPRIFEGGTESFYVGTLFQPERRALQGETHPLITAFVKSASHF